MKSLFKVALLTMFCVSSLCSCAAMKRKRTETKTASTTAGNIATRSQEVELLQTSIDTLLLLSADSLIADFLNDTTTTFKQVESGTMVLQLRRDSTGRIHAKAISKERAVQVKQNTTSVKMRNADSTAQTATKTKTATKTEDAERKALIPEWTWAAGFGVLVLIIAFFLYRFLSRATKE